MMEMPPLPQELTELFNADRFTCSEMERMIRDYGESCARMAREKAAKLCDNVAANYTKHYELGAKECAAAIRKG